MKYWVLIISLFILGCGSGEDTSKSAGAEAADALNNAQDAAEAVGDTLQEKKEAIDEALEEAEDAAND